MSRSDFWDWLGPISMEDSSHSTKINYNTLIYVIMPLRYAKLLKIKAASLSLLLLIVENLLIYNLQMLFQKSILSSEAMTIIFLLRMSRTHPLSRVVVTLSTYLWCRYFRLK